MSLVFSVVSLIAGASEPCELPRIRDTGALSMAITQDRQVAALFQKAAGACTADTKACDQARLECVTLLTATIKGQANFDEGAWLRDMMLPYLGQMYPMSKKMTPTTPASDNSCGGESATLSAAAGRRTAQAAKRQAILDEYPKYAAWVNAAYAKCRDQVVVDQQKAQATQAEAEKVAAAALAAKVAAEAKQRAEIEAKVRQEIAQKAEEEARQKAKAEAAAKKAKEDAAAQAELEKKKAAPPAQTEAEKAEAAKKAKQAEEEKLVRERDARIAQVRAQKVQIVVDAKRELQRAADESNAKHKAAVAALHDRSSAAPSLATEAANAEHARVQAEQKLAEARLKADRIEVDLSSEREWASVSVQGAMGYGTLASTEGQAAGLLLGGQVAGHIGFWRTAPANAMASGLEVRLSARYLTQAGGVGVTQGIDGRAVIRWFFGPFGVGAAAEYRSFSSTLVDSSLRAKPHDTVGAGLGLAGGVALVDRPDVRVMVNVAWLPVVSNDVMRVVADFEVAWHYVMFSIAGGSQTDVVNQPIRVGYFLTAQAGVRLGF